MSKQIDFVDLTGGMGTITADITTNFKLAALKRKALELVEAFPNSAFYPSVSENDINRISFFDKNGEPLDTDEKLKVLLKTNEAGRLVVKYSIQYAGPPGTLGGGSNALGGASNPLGGGRRRRYRRKTQRRNHKKRKSYRRN